MQRIRGLKKSFITYITTGTVVLFLSFQDLSAQQRDTSFISLEGGQVTGVKAKKPVDDAYHSPRKAALYSAVFPGLGQWYNRKYWKVPLVYAGYATLGYFVYFNNTHYVSYRDAYLDFTDEDPATTSYFSVVGNHADPETYVRELYPTTYNKQNYEWIKEQLRNGMQYYKRNRDLSLIGMAGWYVLTILDAVVDAQLFHFDIDPDLSMRIVPAVRPGRGMMAVGGITCNITF